MVADLLGESIPRSRVPRGPPAALPTFPSSWQLLLVIDPARRTHPATGAAPVEPGSGALRPVPLLQKEESLPVLYSEEKERRRETASLSSRQPQPPDPTY